MSSGNNETNGIDVGNLTVVQILKALKPGQIVAIIGGLAALCAAAYFVGVTLDPRANDLSAENARLKAVVDLTQVSTDQNRNFPLNRFIAAPAADLSSLQPIYGGKLYVPPLGKEWVPYTANDLTLLADIIGAPRSHMQNSMPLTFAFNQQNPPRIWIIPNTNETKNGEWIPYIQISLIPRNRAQRLMEAIDRDGLSLVTQSTDVFRKLLQAEFPDHAMKLLDSKIDSLGDVKFLTRTFFNGALTSQETQTVFGKTTTSARKQEKIDSIASKLEKQIDIRFMVPAYLIKNGMASLSNVTPEAGLLFGRLLFYVFGVSERGRVDIDQLVIGYEGSYARLIRTVEKPDPKDPTRSEIFTVVDDVLIIATKSDFCLVHVRIPELNDRLKAIGKNSREWIMQVRMREFR